MLKFLRPIPWKSAFDYVNRVGLPSRTFCSNVSISKNVSSANVFFLSRNLNFIFRAFSVSRESSTAKDISDDEFDSEVIKSKIPVIVDFHADWCAPCKLLAPNLERAVELATSSVKLIKVNVDDCPAVAEKYNVRSLPTVSVFYHGKQYDQFIGYKDLSYLKDFVTKASFLVQK